ncbi:MAG: hypothetical protein ABGX72_06850 [Methyloprofundus sp.]
MAESGSCALSKLNSDLFKSSNASGVLAGINRQRNGLAQRLPMV